METSDQPSGIRRFRWWASDLIAIARGALPSGSAVFRANASPSPSQQAAIQECIAWLENYIAQPHSQLGRNGDICPFVNTALRKRKLRYEVLERITAPNLVEIRNRLLYEAWRLPRTIDPNDRAGELTTVNLLFPNLRGEATKVIHAVHEQCKTSLMRRGVMLAAFFPGYEKPAIYNPDFTLYQAPFPVLVVRPMALHDIVFLDNNREGFVEYHRRFRARYAAGKVSEEFGYPERFRNATQRFGLASS